MQTWRTVIQLKTSLNPSWFCLALNPLSKTLNITGMGYTLKNQQVKHHISNQLYMDGLIRHVSSPDTLKELIQLVEKFFENISAYKSRLR